MDNQTNPSSDTPLTSYKFSELIKQLKLEDSWNKGGRSAKTIYKTGVMNV
ncbi:hypothetical protein [Cesiribacter sp. SM1]|nr:hypothetical protein [Cesiribacter sp. SM1]